MMEQWHKFKKLYPDAILFFRAGDFYEMFFEDAKLGSRELGITLTTRGREMGKDIPLAGIPYHALDPYLAKLVKKGYKIAICEQVEDPKKTKKLVRRDVVRVVTPGTLMEDNLLEEKSSNYLAAISHSREGYGLAIVELSTGEFLVTEFTAEKAKEKLLDEIAMQKPAEVILEESLFELEGEIKSYGVSITPYRDEAFLHSLASRAIWEHFKINDVRGLGLEEKSLAISAAGAALSYLKETQRSTLEHISSIRLYSQEEYLIIDSITEHNLELIRNLRDGSKKGTLLEVLDYTSTPMGGRLLRKWILRPLKNVEEIKRRLEAVEELYTKSFEREKIEERLGDIRDLERIIARVSYGSANARDLLALNNSLSSLPEIKNAFESLSSDLIKELASDIDPPEELTALLEKALEDNPPATVREGGMIKEGFSIELDELKKAVFDGKDWIIKLEERERRRTGISSLKVSYNSVFGYYINVTKSNLKYVPESYIRKQTLVNAERFIIPELKEKEALILGSEEKIKEMEYSLFQKLREACAEKTENIQTIAESIAGLDVLVSLARAAYENSYVKPEVSDGEEIIIEEGRHPTVEKTLNNFIANGTKLSRNEKHLIITGPNMAGKSTYLRQVALIVLLAQMGSFVPASKAEISVVDRIFTRVGASDDLASGRSTFMVEMQETANILNNATGNSLVILDEIGRGTSTFDGLSIAWAVAEYLNERIKCKVLFATHYHHLAELEKVQNGVKNYHIEVQETDNDIIFLRRVREGSADRSYGIQVARLAGLPREVIDNAFTVLKRIEEEEVVDEKLIAKRLRRKKLEKVLGDSGQKTLFDITMPSKVEEELGAIDVNKLSPLEALNKLAELVESVRREKSITHD